MQDKHIYCVKCQAAKTVVGQSPVTFRNGSVAVKGRCPSCDSVAYKIVSKEALKSAVKSEPVHDHRILMATAAFAMGMLFGAAVSMYL